jgi:hypothetical protein
MPIPDPEDLILSEPLVEREIDGPPGHPAVPVKPMPAGEILSRLTGVPGELTDTEASENE